MRILTNIRNLRNRLTKFDGEEPLTKLALTLIILLDIFILSIVFGGLSSHTHQLTSPSEYFPHECRYVFIENNWNSANKLDRLQSIVLKDFNQYSYRYDKSLDNSKIKNMHEICKAFYESVNSIAADAALKKLFIRRQELAKQKNLWTQKFNNTKQVYDTSLLENIAGDETHLSELSKQSKSHSEQIEQIAIEIAQLDNQLCIHPKIVNLWELIRPDDATQRATLIRDLNRYARFFTFKELIWQLIFMLPLLFAFYFWHILSIKRDRTVQTLISSHLLVVASIPVITKFIDVVLDLIPNHFFKELFKLLELLHIIALWHYIVILFSVIATIMIVHFIQRKWFNLKQLHQKRLMKGECHQCGKHLPPNVKSCPFCGTDQYVICSHCSKDTFVVGEYCVRCGEK